MRPLILLQHPDRGKRRAFAAALDAEGYRVVACADSDEACRLARDRSPSLAVLFLPALDDGAEDPLELPPSSPSAWSGSRLRATSTCRDMPILTITSRRIDAIRHGFKNLLSDLCTLRELVVSVEVLLERNQPRTLRGDLTAIAMPDVLQAVVPGGRSGHLELRDPEIVGTLWFTDGRVVDARTPGGRDGLAAALDLVVASSGTFQIELGPVFRPRTIHLALNILLLEALRRQDILAALEVGGFDAELHATEAASFLSRRHLRPSA